MDIWGSARPSSSTAHRVAQAHLSTNHNVHPFPPLAPVAFPAFESIAAFTSANHSGSGMSPKPLQIASCAERPDDPASVPPPGKPADSGHVWSSLHICTVRSCQRARPTQTLALSHRWSSAVLTVYLQVFKWGTRRPRLRRQTL
eukprot:scaffold290_cov367-Pinguiococcus_pyrenoidosus.AAC.7